MLAPARCGGCGDELPGPAVAPTAGEVQGSWCVHCWARCGPTAGYWVAGQTSCPGWAAAAYRGRVRRALLQAKRGAPAASVALLLDRWPVGGLPAGAHVTWVPAHPRRALRGPDAGKVLAQALATREGLPVERLLWRVPWARRQAGRTVADRAAAPHRLGLRAVGRAPRSIVLVDDVRTTGTTLDHAAALLRAAGAQEILAITVAAAPGAEPR